MSRHIADRPRTFDGARVKRFAEIARRLGDEGSHRAARMLHSRPASRAAGARLRAFLRIDRGWTA